VPRTFPTDKRMILVIAGRYYGNHENLWDLKSLAPGWSWINAHRLAHNIPSILETLDKEYVKRVDEVFKKDQSLLLKVIEEIEKGAILSCYCPLSNKFCHIRILAKRIGQLRGRVNYLKDKGFLEEALKSWR